MASRPSESDRPLLPDENENEEYQPTAPLANMGVSLSTARVIAPVSFIFDFLCQQYGLNLAKPDMQRVHEMNPGCFTPNAYFIGGFFGPQQIVQLLWLREFFRPDRDVEKGTIRYAPWYALGNLCIGVWMFFWTANNMKGSAIPVIINTLTQVYYVYALRDKEPKTYQAKLTNVIAMTFAGVGLLDFFHNVTVAWFPATAPNTLTQVLTVIGAPLAALASPLLMGACIAYDLIGVSVGQHQLAQHGIGGYGGGGGGENWSRLMGGLGLATAGVVAARHFAGARWV